MQIAISKASPPISITAIMGIFPALRFQISTTFPREPGLRRTFLTAGSLTDPRAGFFPVRWIVREKAGDFSDVRHTGNYDLRH